MTETFTTKALATVLAELRRQGYRHIAVTPLTHATVNGRPGNTWAHDLNGIFGWSRPFHAHILPDKLFDQMREADILTPHEDGWRSLVRVATLDGLMFLHSAYPTEAADAVFFGPDTYRFATAIREALDHCTSPIKRAVDIGCGAGPGAILLARAMPKAEVLAVDINPRALALTQVNAIHNGTPNVHAVHSNLLSDVTGSFDFVVANPPYLVDPAQRAYRHGGGPLGADFALAVIDAAVARLAPGGTLLLYTGVAIIGGVDSFRAAAGERLDAAGATWAYREIDPDIFGEELLNPSYADTDRIAAVVLTAQRPL